MCVPSCKIRFPSAADQPLRLTEYLPSTVPPTSKKYLSIGVKTAVYKKKDKLISGCKM
jgi:hypothetical protein